MVPFEVITNSCSRNYRAKSLLAQPRIDGPSNCLNARGRCKWRGAGEVGSAHTGGSRNAQALHQRIWSQFVTHSAIQSIIGGLRPGWQPTQTAESVIRSETLRS